MQLMNAALIIVFVDCLLVLARWHARRDDIRNAGKTPDEIEQEWLDQNAW